MDKDLINGNSGEEEEEEDEQYKPNPLFEKKGQ